MTMTLSKTFVSSSSMQRREVVRQPGDLLRLARAGRVLDEVVVPGAVHARVRLALDDDVPLVVAREDDRRARALAFGSVGRLDVDELLDQLEPAVAIPDLAPDVRRRVPVLDARVARRRRAGPAPPDALVERQEDRLRRRRGASSCTPAPRRPRSARTRGGRTARSSGRGRCGTARSRPRPSGQSSGSSARRSPSASPLTNSTRSTESPRLRVEAHLPHDAQPVGVVARLGRPGRSSAPAAAGTARARRRAR